MMSIYELTIKSIVPENKLMAHYLIESDNQGGLNKIINVQQTFVKIFVSEPLAPHCLHFLLKLM